MKCWKIYKHTLISDCPSKGKSYIGQTSADNPKCRWAGGNGYSRHNPVFYNAIKKYGWDNFTHEIIIDNIMSLEEANKLEKELIAKYHTWIGDSECWGYNTTPGGSGRSHKQSELTKQKISQTLKGRTFTDDHKAKLSAKRIKKSIICIETGVIYASQLEAAKQTGIRRENIRMALKGARMSAGGYHWAAVDDTDKQQELLKLAGKCKPAKAQVICVETGIIYESITAAAKALHISKASISHHLAGQRSSAGGYHWKYLKK